MVLEKFRFEHNGYLIRAASSAEEIIEEGKVLMHCVGGYADRHANGETNILLIRKISDPDKPYFTMEVKANQIIQTQGFKHVLPTGDVKEFVAAFKAEKLEKKPAKSKTKNKKIQPTIRQEVAV
jgi:hypothetical protein